MASQFDQEQKQVYPPQQPGPGYGPAMGYPPTMGYHQQGYQQQGYQQGYPPPPYPPAAYSYPHNPYNSQQQEVDARACKFVCGVLIGIILLVVFMVSTSIISWLALRPELPVAHLSSFVVTNFDISKRGETVATFEANITIENPNTKFTISSKEVTGFVYYNNRLVASSVQESFFIDIKENKMIDTKVTRNDTNPIFVLDYEITESMSKDRSAGKIMFNYKLVSLVGFKSGSWLPRHSILKVHCDDLIVSFGNDNVGSMSGGKECSVKH